MSAPKPGQYGEPWKTEKQADNLGNKIITKLGYEPAFDLPKCDSERIVSCVNALEGLDPEALRPLLALCYECLSDYSHPNFTDRSGMADRLRAALGAFVVEK